MCPFVSADVRGGGRLRDEPKECLRRRLEFSKKCEAIKQIFTSQTLKVLLVYAGLREFKFLGRCSLASGTHLHQNKF